MTAVSDFVAVVDRLLAPEGGCVWNRAKTHASLARYAVEESYELVDAIDDGDDDDLREELGDVLYQVVLHAGVSAAAGGFDLEDVAAGVRDKMVRRHPHVFGDERADTEEEVVRVWRAAKAAEKAGRRSVFDGVPRAMPPLERAVKLLERLGERGDADAVLAAVVGGGAGVDVDRGAVVDADADADVDADAGAGGSGAGHGVPAGDVGRADESEADGSSDPAADARWGIAVLEQVAAARAAGIDPVAGLRAAVGLLEAQGRAVDEAEARRG